MTNEESTLTGPIDERTAWALVRAVPRVLASGQPPIRVHHNHLPDVWLQVESSGQWEVSGPVDDPARDLLDLYLPLQLLEKLTIAQIGQSIDGRIATETGNSHYVTGPADIVRLHRLRALVDAVVVGAHTVALDDPRLTVRQAEGANPVRVVLDPEGRLDADRRIFSDKAARTIRVQRSADEHAGRPGNGDTTERVAVSADAEGHFDPGVVLDALRARGLRRVLVEGGGVTVSQFLRAGVLDRLHVTVAPLVIGSGRPALTLEPIDSLENALRPTCRHFQLGDDVLFDFDLRRSRPAG